MNCGYCGHREGYHHMECECRYCDYTGCFEHGCDCKAFEEIDE